MSPSREISRIVPGVESLRALAHPDRLRILGVLRIEGPSTATSLAQRFGLNSGATSYHLRQLAHHGFIEPAEDLGNRRERWWRSRHESTFYETAGLTGAELEAGLAFSQAILTRHVAQMQRAHESYRDLPVEWREASTQSDYIFPFTAEQAQALREKLEALLWEAKAAAPPSDTAPEGTRPYMVVLHAFPHPGFEGPA
jgi:DNA-binding transcriptional ArsR family regulator